MSRWQIALVREQGINFAVASVKDHVVCNSHTAERTIAALNVSLRQPVVLLSATGNQLYGRRDIVRFLENVHPSRLPWRYVDIAA